jgi:hypothetical protein
VASEEVLSSTELLSTSVYSKSIRTARESANRGRLLEETSQCILHFSGTGA